MPRTKVYQLRLTPEEKMALAGKARNRDLSIAQMIRRDYGLAEAGIEVTDRLEELHGAIQHLTQQLKNQGYTTPVAERMARKQLGL